MWLRLNNLRVPVELPEAELPRHIADVLGLRPDDLACVAHPAQKSRRAGAQQPAVRLLSQR